MFSNAFLNFTRVMLKVYPLNNKLGGNDLHPSLFFQNGFVSLKLDRSDFLLSMEIDSRERIGGPEEVKCPSHLDQNLAYDMALHKGLNPQGQGVAHKTKMFRKRHMPIKDQHTERLVDLEKVHSQTSWGMAKKQAVWRKPAREAG